MHTLFLDALHCCNLERPPVWLMRQAGRYMPEYRKIREKHSFLEMCHQPEIAAQVTLLPIQKFGMDAAILFSDILVIPEALGLGLDFEAGHGPVFERPLNNADDIQRLPRPNIREALGYVGEAIRHVSAELTVPLIGFCGAPFTLASYMIEGKSSHDLKKTKQWMLRDPKSFHHLLTYLSECAIEYLNMQIDSGVNAIQIFDSWANTLGNSHFREFSLSYMTRIIAGLKNPQIPVILFCRGSSVFLNDLMEANPRGISLDWNIDLAKARTLIPDNIALQGNMDPDVLYAPLDIVKTETQRLLNIMKNDKGYIFNLGHGVKPDVPVAAVQTLVETIKSYRS